MQLVSLSPPPFRPSGLRHTDIPPHPLSPNCQTRFPTALKTTIPSVTTPPPPQPMPWTWQCHLCRRQYAFSATRRCLEDGHHFCAGGASSTSAVRRYGASAAGTGKPGRRAKNSKACLSEFDYSGWGAYGEWRRAEVCARRRLQGRATDDDDGGEEGAAANCGRYCSYPSECRWSGVLAKRSGSESSETAEGRGAAAWTPGTPTFEVLLGLGIEEGVDAGAGASANTGRSCGRRKRRWKGKGLGRILEEDEDGDAAMFECDVAC